MPELKFQVYAGANAPIMFGLLWIALDKGYFEEQGVEVKAVVGNSPLGEGENDVDFRCGSPAELGRLAISDAPVIAITTQEQWRDGRGLTPLCARRELIETGSLTDDLTSLRGKRVGFEFQDGKLRPEPDWILVQRALQLAGLTMDDIEIVDAPHGQSVGPLTRGEVDIINMPRPREVVQGEENDTLSRWHECWEVAPRQARCVLARRSLVEARPETIEGFVTAWVRASRDYVEAITTGRGKEEIVDLLIRYSGEDRLVVEKMSPLGANPDGVIDVASMQRDVDDWASAGLLPRSVDIASKVELSFANRALAKLGSYSAGSA